MWVLELQDGGGECDACNVREIFLVAGNHILGRKGKDVNIEVTDPSISRKHASIVVEEAFEEGDKSLMSRPTIAISDCGSSFGTEVDGKAVVPKELIPLKEGQVVKFGKANFKYKLKWKMIVICTSGLSDKSMKEEARAASRKCGCFLLDVFTSSVTHVLTPPTNEATIKILHALVRCLPIIHIQWLQAILNRRRLSHPLPSELSFTPVCKNNPLLDYHPHVERKFVLRDHHFVYLNGRTPYIDIFRLAGATIYMGPTFTLTPEIKKIASSHRVFLINPPVGPTTDKNLVELRKLNCKELREESVVNSLVYFSKTPDWITDTLEIEAYLADQKKLLLDYYRVNGQPVTAVPTDITPAAGPTLNNTQVIETQTGTQNMHPPQSASKTPIVKKVVKVVSLFDALDESMPASQGIKIMGPPTPISHAPESMVDSLQRKEVNPNLVEIPKSTSKPFASIPLAGPLAPEPLLKKRKAEVPPHNESEAASILVPISKKVNSPSPSRKKSTKDAATSSTPTTVIHDAPIDDASTRHDTINKKNASPLLSGVPVPPAESSQTQPAAIHAGLSDGSEWMTSKQASANKPEVIPPVITEVEEPVLDNNVAVTTVAPTNDDTPAPQEDDTLSSRHDDEWARHNHVNSRGIKWVQAISKKHDTDSSTPATTEDKNVTVVEFVVSVAPTRNESEASATPLRLLMNGQKTFRKRRVPISNTDMAVVSWSIKDNVKVDQDREEAMQMENKTMDLVIDSQDVKGGKKRKRNE